jgi:hypothetical protein
VVFVHDHAGTAGVALVVKAGPGYELSSCRSSITSYSRSSSGARSFSSRSVIVHPSRSGAAVSSRTSADPGTVYRSAPSTASPPPLRIPLISPADTHAARPARPAPPIQDRGSTILPLSGGADITVTRPHHLIRLLLARTSASAMPPQVTPDLRQA